MSTRVYSKKERELKSREKLEKRMERRRLKKVVRAVVHLTPVAP